MNRITALENHGSWVKVFYKTAKGRKVYSLFVAASDVFGDTVRSFFFEGKLI
jgi:hypothetical protein